LKILAASSEEYSITDKNLVNPPTPPQAAGLSERNSNPKYLNRAVSEDAAFFLFF
jgi:hypothetical protein